MNDKKTFTESIKEILERQGTGQLTGKPSPQPNVDQPTTLPVGKRKAFRDIKRSLSENDLTNPATSRFLLDEIERLDSECDRLREFEGKFHEADKDAAVLKEKNKSLESIDVYFAFALSLGFALIGLSPSYWKYKPISYIIFGIGLILPISSIVIRMVKK